MKSLVPDILKTTLYSILGWIFIAPLAIIIPKKKRRTIIIGRNKGEYLDNTKYLHIYLSENETDLETYWVTEKKSTYNELSQHYSNILLHPSPESITKMLTAHIVVVDAMDWQYKLKYHLLLKAKRVQLWHGVGFKKILNLSHKFKADMSDLYPAIRAKLVGRTPLYHLFISTSDFYSQKTFNPAFKPQRIEALGYPRNDYMFVKSEKQFIGSPYQYHKKIVALKKQGARIITYMPTFRTPKSQSETAFDMDSLNNFARENNFYFVIKGHILTWGQEQEKSNIIFYPNSKDIYPILPLSDLLITDYSSVYMDFLFLNRPILFYCYDLEQYIKEDNIQFDYNWITPGEKCHSQNILQQKIAEILLQGHDKFKKEREEIFALAFKHHDSNSSKRITEELENLC